MAASTRLSYTPTSVGGIHLANAARYAILAKQEIARAKAIADSITGGGVTPANLEGSPEFGTAAGLGATLYTAISNLNTNLATVTSTQLADADQGG